MKAVLAEFIGTFFLVLTTCLCVSEPGAGPLAPIAIGSIYAAMLTACGHVSGGHLNPAISLAAAFRRSLRWRWLLPYWIAQLLGGLAAAWMVLVIKGGVSTQPFVPPIWPAFFAELVFTFALCFVVLNVSRTGEGTFGLAPGLTLAAGIFAVGAISGAAFNPAVALGLCGLNLLAFSSLWIYLLASLFAAVFATTIFVAVNGRKSRDKLHPTHKEKNPDHTFSVYWN